jgi:hypothetical protein
MADVKISGLPASTLPLAGTEVLPIVQSGVTKKVATSAFLLPSNIGNTVQGYDADTTKNNVANTFTQIQTIQVPGGAPSAVASSLSLLANNALAADMGAAIAFGGKYTSSDYTVWGAIAGLKDNAVVGEYGGYLAFYTRPNTAGFVERLRINTVGDVTVNTGNLVIGTSGKGIDFSATAGTGTSELLADYEEGTWTPTVGGNTTYLVQEGYYTKVGRIVTIQGKIQIDVIGTGSTTTISGLPFAQLSASNASNSGGGVSYFAGIATSVYTLIPYVINGNTTIIFESQTAAGFTSSNYQTTVFQGGTRLDFFLTYTAAS